jgi:hypothetical protein
MDNLTHPGQADNPISDADALVCSPEFSGGCADPQEGMPPELAPGAPIPEVEPRPEPVKADAGEEPVPVLTHNATEVPEPGFPEVACSAEFRKGCVNPSEESL